MALNADLDICLVRKLGVPGREELAVGAIASGGMRVLHTGVIKAWAIPDSVIEQVSSREKQELERRESIYRQGRQQASISGKCVILVDDALATGSSMLAAVRAVRARKPSKTVVAIPVSPPDTCEELGNEVDEIVCAYTPATFTAVSVWYENFSQTSDEEVEQFYETAARRFDRLAS